MPGLSPPRAEIDGKVIDLLADTGLQPLGWFSICDEAATKRAGLLIGNCGGSIWPTFQRSDECLDGKPDPLNRWTQRVIDPMAKMLGAQARYPFGDRVWPFQRWARAAMGVQSSPLGLLIHPEYGLWVAFRAALVFDVDETDTIPNENTALVEHPCDTCIDKPCLNTCPVNAFSAEGFLVATCRSFLETEEGQACRLKGCKARLACPVGQQFAYTNAQQAFHMAHFLK
ncbi:MAG: hypothetical protein AAGF28_04785 [Pseudomonadota bacterium]